MSFPYHKQEVTPLVADMAIHYATCCNDYRDIHYAPAIKEAIVWLVKHGIIRMTTSEEREAGWEGIYSGTEKGRAWVDLMCKTPFPIEMWVDPRTEEII